MKTAADLLHWLPPISNFRGALDEVRAEAQPELRTQKLVRLAGHRLDFLQAIQIERLLQETPVDPSVLRPLRLALAGTSTLDHLLPAIVVAGLRRGLRIQTYNAGYGQYRQELLDPGSGLYRFQPNVILLALDVHCAVESIPLTASTREVDARLDEWIDDYRSLWSLAREGMGTPVIQHSFLNAAESVFGQYDAAVPASPSSVIDKLNLRLASAAAEAGVLIADIARFARRLGAGVWFDPVRWFQAKQEISPVVAPLYGDLVARVLAAQCGLSRKCLVLDLDNTLWGGVVGDDGLEGIVLGQGNPAGEAYAAFQRYCKKLSERGVMLAVCSKNERAVADTVFQQHPEMILKASDIAAFAVNWRDKASNLRELASLLNIGLDSLVFFDDNPVERALIREELPMVAVPEVPQDPAQYTRCLADAGYFEAVAFTAEDSRRTGQYVANVGRESLRQSAASLEDFLRGLDMQFDARPFQPPDLTRITQLVNKTNQFNLRTQRLTHQQVAALAADPQVLTMQIRVADKFGDNGLIGVIVLRPEQHQDSDALFIDTWLMSCRVMGRRVEMEACNRLVAAARQRGVARLIGEYIPTPKNSMVRDLFPDLGFRPAHANGNGAARWELLVDSYTPHQTWFRSIET